SAGSGHELLRGVPGHRLAKTHSAEPALHRVPTEPGILLSQRRLLRDVLRFGSVLCGLVHSSWNAHQTHQPMRSLRRRVVRRGAQSWGCSCVVSVTEVVVALRRPADTKISSSSPTDTAAASRSTVLSC